MNLLDWILLYFLVAVVWLFAFAATKRYETAAWAFIWPLGLLNAWYCRRQR